MAQTKWLRTISVGEGRAPPANIDLYFAKIHYYQRGSSRTSTPTDFQKISLVYRHFVRGIFSFFHGRANPSPTEIDEDFSSVQTHRQIKI